MKPTTNIPAVCDTDGKW